jgi:hypothetical protein
VKTGIKRISLEDQINVKIKYLSAPSSERKKWAKTDRVVTKRTAERDISLLR